MRCFRNWGLAKIVFHWSVGVIGQLLLLVGKVITHLIRFLHDYLNI